MDSSQGKNSGELQHFSFDAMPVERLNPLLDRQFVAGERSMVARLVLRTGCIVPMHSHEHEQISHVLEGALRFTAQGKEIMVRAGDVLVIPSNVPHSAEALEDTIALDVFCPPREDWISGTDAYLRK